MERISICPGCIVVRGLLPVADLADLSVSFESLVAAPVPGLFDPTPLSPDPLMRFPRIMNPHRHPEVAAGTLALRFLLDPAVLDVLRSEMHDEPLAIQSMYYFKPPGARGQGYHQDNRFAQVQPGTCWSAWMPIDRSDPDNGCLHVVPGLAGAAVADGPSEDHGRYAYGGVARPAGAVAVDMDPGDVLFFDGQVVHGSEPNGSARFRRSLICHYAPASCRSLAAAFHPALDASGRAAPRDISHLGSAVT